MALERVQKILAQAGIASRRKAEELILEGAVTINGKLAKLGDKAELGKDAIKVSGKLIQTAEAPVYVVFHKPKGVISMMVDTENRPTLADYLGKIRGRIFPIGRLDFNSEGLILLTNVGGYAEKIQRRDDIPRVYRIMIRGKLDQEMLSRIEKGAKLGEHRARMFRPHSVRVVQEWSGKTEIELVVLGGGAVDLKSYLEMKGFLVNRVTRTAFGHITLKGLPPGHYRLLKTSQAEALLEQPELGMKKIERDAEEAREIELPAKRELKSTTKLELDLKSGSKLTVKKTKAAQGPGTAPTRSPRGRIQVRRKST